MARVVFRSDASSASGSGHVARCMALARALVARGARVELISRSLPQHVRELHVACTGALVHDLPEPEAALKALRDEGEPSAHAHWLGVSQRTDAAQTMGVLRAGEAADWLIVDHYALDARWENAVRPHVGNVLVIDDLADRDHACDALLDQNFYLDSQTRYDGRVPRRAGLMLGPKFALLREEFALARKSIGVRDGTLRRIFVCFGGFDPARQTLRALDAIEGAGTSNVAVDIVVAQNDPQRSEIEMCCTRNERWCVYFDSTNIAELMASADLAIGASGGMNWERAALCLPAVIASVAENQHELARDLASDHACIYLGVAQDWRAETLAGLLRGLAGTPALLRALGTRAGELCDGRGAQRVAARLLPEPIALRRATPNDCEPMHRWRNAEETRRHAFDAEPIALEGHRRWFERALADQNIVLLIGERTGEPIGVLRYDLAGERATVSVYLVPAAHGRGYGTALLEAGSRWIRAHHPQVTRLDAQIMQGNQRSLEAFSDAGYRAASHTYTRELAHD